MRKEHHMGLFVRNESVNVFNKNGSFLRSQNGFAIKQVHFRVQKIKRI